MIKAEDLREQVIRPTLEALAVFNPKLNSEAAIDLLMGTAASESRLGYNLVQEGGPAKGIYQMEAATHDDVWRYLNRPGNRELRLIVRTLAKKTDPDELIHNLKYATAMARIRYWYVPEAMPETLEEQAKYWKAHYNTESGAGTPEKYLERHEKYLGE